jgi:uncharacterized protein (TIGR02246 family)
VVLPALEGWDSFYVIIGSSAAALTGLMFVVIALLPVTSRPRDPTALDAFATPTIVHFCAVLLIGALVEIPRHSLQSLRACLVVSGAIGLGYALLVVRRTMRQTSYSPELEDWIWHCTLPVIAYLSLFSASLFVVIAPEKALVAVGASALMLLFIGIHNAWDAAVWMTTAEQTMQEDEKKIRELMDQWLRSTKEGDLQTILTLMADDVVFLTPGHPPMNKDGFVETFKSFAGKVKFDAKQDIKELRVSSDQAYCWSTMTLTMDGKTRAGNILSVFRKLAGKWVLSRDANFVA